MSFASALEYETVIINSYSFTTLFKTYVLDDRIGQF